MLRINKPEKAMFRVGQKVRYLFAEQHTDLKVVAKEYDGHGCVYYTVAGKDARLQGIRQKNLVRA